MKTKSVLAEDSLSATLEVRFTSGALALEHRVPLVYTWGHVVDPMGLALESLVDSFQMKLRLMLSCSCSIFRRILWPSPRSSERGALGWAMK